MSLAIHTESGLASQFLGAGDEAAKSALGRIDNRQEKLELERAINRKNSENVAPLQTALEQILSDTGLGRYEANYYRGKSKEIIPLTVISSDGDGSIKLTVGGGQKGDQDFSFEYDAKKGTYTLFKQIVYRDNYSEDYGKKSKVKSNLSAEDAIDQFKKVLMDNVERLHNDKNVENYKDYQESRRGLKGVPKRYPKWVQKQDDIKTYIAQINAACDKAIQDLRSPSPQAALANDGMG